MLNNFTLITSGGCNAKCSFCTDPMNYKPSEDYIKNFIGILFGDKLPPDYRQISISGGEPTISPDLPLLLSLIEASGRFDKIVLTTNGTNLLRHINAIGTTVDHVNVSRHGVGYAKNAIVFKNKQIISDEDLTAACMELSKFGVDVNLNWVYNESDSLSLTDVHEYVEYAKRLGASKVTFRHDQNTNSIEQTALEKMFDGYGVIESGACPVCRSKTIMFLGMPVTFKSSFAEPGNELGEVYELIYHPSGKLTTDWAGKKEFCASVVTKKPKAKRATPTYNYGRCGSSGCG